MKNLYIYLYKLLFNPSVLENFCFYELIIRSELFFKFILFKYQKVLDHI